MSKLAKHGWALASFNNLEGAPTSIPHQTQENRHANAPCNPSMQNMWAAKAAWIHDLQHNRTQQNRRTDMNTTDQRGDKY
eukprot:363866-Chlamydomonas_euryale.AAC.6